MDFNAILADRSNLCSTNALDVGAQGV